LIIISSIDLLKTKIENLSEYTQELSVIKPDITYEKGAWTALKDAFLLNYIRNVYTPIIKNFYDNFYYIDFCAGSGLVKIDKDIILGSPIVAAIAHEKPFTKMFFLENDIKKANALDERMKRLKEFSEFNNINYEVIRGDCNKTIDEVIQKMKLIKGSHHRLAFFDPEGLEIDYNTYAKCLKMPTDLIFNFQTPGIHREISSAFKVPERERKRLSKMFGGSDIWKECNTREETL
jgi:three-Cys-motif partner protein